MSNSDLTSSTQRLSQKGLYSPSNYRGASSPPGDKHSGLSPPPLSGTTAMPSGARAHSSSSSNGRQSSSQPVSSADMMKKSVSFNKRTPRGGAVTGNSKTAHHVACSGRTSVPNGTTINSHHQPLVNGNINNGDTSSNHDSELSSSAGGAPKSLQDSQWYTRPIHRDHHTGSSTLKDLSHLGLSIDSAHPVQMAPRGQAETAGQQRPPGTSLTAERLHNSAKLLNAKDAGASYAPPADSSVNILASDFFPVTLGAAYDTLRSPTDDDSSNSKSSLTVSSPSGKGLPHPNSTPWKVKRSRSPGRSRKSRPGSAQSSSSSNSKNSIDRMYLMTVEAPNLGKFYSINIIYTIPSRWCNLWEFNTFCLC